MLRIIFDNKNGGDGNNNQRRQLAIGASKSDESNMRFQLQCPSKSTSHDPHSQEKPHKSEKNESPLTPFYFIKEKDS